ncbi:MAG: tRNA glutamyl-Q(34) synthetase GluQRS [Candidatus Lambdaproteobacteria bacterium RIFOXYD1_FULL_56_27]|uniref:Glutamyl-Q tRNA(Asp) synthetase n=1 Tax=Candidatus Lambdaproteobacteria bacterium RIFOXYD2_FULL_56_26 TaxID=1817773 RepID=A0A1F6GRQ3_9PROT|nr:MAG: tRNA glutamyl-Q(34) synthetase GluQRS [Candidatus Lambdaproteobacteria bacterium RIFOXYC1_FULL_56_13]OGH00671.1 MAG: tRNA glutamyl-Q(34) synthetase GluQRS [Candidatus Lambdaproteobacteria bacterium RIFOXYD2_FULL_56_26]OGH07838.1 MAG: tRNA glutamyl-Q(34) synthetase GluQRS [Candidatus Lambdaproteobacteria bacterium RIFOXYD1_FULL_56_27]
MPVGRFAPTPSGDLHFGSLVGALGSYLSVKVKGGIWRLRIDDLDQPRVVPGAVDRILVALEQLGLEWDGPVLYQSARLGAYRAGIEALEAQGWIYPCSCSRKDLSATAPQGPEGPIYPGTCRTGMAGTLRSYRVRTQGRITWEDGLYGTQALDLNTEVGDFPVCRFDRLPSYHLATVVDEGLDGITEVVRGADLLTSTFRQLYLLDRLGQTRPAYLHLPVAVNAQGEKLSKQTLAPGLKPEQASLELWLGLRFLDLNPPLSLRAAPVKEQLVWGLTQGGLGALRPVKTKPLPPEVAGN